MFTTLLFDWDGCLADTLSIWMISYKKIFSEYGYYPTEKDIVEKVFGQWKGSANIGDMDHDEFRNKLFHLAIPQLEKVSLHENVFTIIHKLHETQKKMAVITSMEKETILKAIKYNKLEKYFQLVIGRKDVENLKPNPEGIKKAIAYFKSTKENTLIVGDGDKDILAAKNAGIQSVLFYPKPNRVFYSEEFLNNFKPDFTIYDFKDLLRIVK